MNNLGLLEIIEREPWSQSGLSERLRSVLFITQYLI